MPGVDAEENGLVLEIVGQRGGQRAVGVEAEPRFRRALDARAHVGERVRDLTVAVELVAEEIRDDDDLRPQLREDRHRGGLVALDDGVLLPAAAGERGIHHELRGDARQEVRARAVGEVRFALIGKGLLDHAGAGGLAVGAGDGDGFDVLRQNAEQPRTDAQRPAPGHGGAAPVQQARHKAQQLAQDDREKGTKSHIRNSLEVSGSTRLYYNTVYAPRQGFCRGEYRQKSLIRPPAPPSVRA